MTLFEAQMSYLENGVGFNSNSERRALYPAYRLE
jgi:hypothetical protein